MQSIGGQCGIGAPLGNNKIGGESFIRHVGSDKLILDFHEGSGTTVHDKSHCGNNGTLTNPTDLTWERNELDFGGTNGHIVVASSSDFDFLDNKFFMEIIIEFDNFANYQGILTRRANGAGNYWQFTTWNDGTLYFYSEDMIINDFTSILTANKRNDILLTCDGSYLSIYNNNASIFAKDIAGLALDNTHPLRIGYSKPHGVYLDGSIKFVRLGSKTLSQIEIQQEYLANKFRGNN